MGGVGIRGRECGEWGSEVYCGWSGDHRAILGIKGRECGEWGSEVGSAGSGDERLGK